MHMYEQSDLVPSAHFSSVPFSALVRLYHDSLSIFSAFLCLSVLAHLLNMKMTASSHESAVRNVYYQPSSKMSAK